MRVTAPARAAPDTRRQRQFGELERARIDTLYHDATVAFLSKWRVFYGFGFTRYALPMSLHSWYAPSGGEPTYLESVVREVDVNSVRATFGYSTLDYASKYETGYHGLFFDLRLDGGAAFLSFDEISSSPDAIMGDGLPVKDPNAEDSSAASSLSSMSTRPERFLAAAHSGKGKPLSSST